MAAICLSRTVRISGRPKTRFFSKLMIGRRRSRFSLLEMTVGDFVQQILTVFSMIASRTILTLAREVDWEAVSRFAEDSILEPLRNDPDFLQSPDLRSQCFHACRILRVNRVPCAPYSLVTRIGQVNKGTIKRHHKKWKSHSAAPLNGGAS
jgi:hypothetical protein